MAKSTRTHLLAVVIAAAAVAATATCACRDRTRDGETRTAASITPTPTSDETERLASATPHQHDDPFAAKISAHLHAIPDPQITYAEDRTQDQITDNQEFRDRVIAFVRRVSRGGEQVSCDIRLPSQMSTHPFTAVIWLFHDGTVVGRGMASDGDICVAFKEATRRAIAATENNREAVEQARIVAELPDRDYSMVEYEGRGIELSHGLVPVRSFDKKLLAGRIEQGKAYLHRVIDARHDGVHKYYHAPNDTFENTLHTIYTASTVFTMLKLHTYNQALGTAGDSDDAALLKDIQRATDFLLSMQSRDSRERSYGGFFYSYDVEHKQPSPKLVVGTTSKTIFTLIELHALTREARYMEAAKLAADWLISMQRPDGSVRSYLRRTSTGQWSFGKQESTLYTGQVLSALSRMYRATDDMKYREAASRTAQYMLGKIAKEGCYLGDEYRKPNPVSSSWAILSLFDFVRATGDTEIEGKVFQCANELLDRQIRNIKDVYRHGRWHGSLTSSGNGWLAEVMSELYMYCRKNDMGGCGRFKGAITRVLRLLTQYAYTPESAFVAKNPDAARGGVFWNVAARYVRTDAVCHAMNAFVYMIPYLDDDKVLLEVPEPPLAERLTVAGSDESRAATDRESPAWFDLGAYLKAVGKQSEDGRDSEDGSEDGAAFDSDESQAEAAGDDQ